MKKPITTEPHAPPPDLLLVDGFKVDLGAGVALEEILDHKVGEGLAFFVTLEGRMNRSEERRTVHVMLNAEHGYNLGSEIMERLEEFVKLMKGLG